MLLPPPQKQLLKQLDQALQDGNPRRYQSLKANGELQAYLNRLAKRADDLMYEQDESISSLMLEKSKNPNKDLVPEHNQRRLAAWKEILNQLFDEAGITDPSRVD